MRPSLENQSPPSAGFHVSGVRVWIEKTRRIQAQIFRRVVWGVERYFNYLSLVIWRKR